ncbi:MAG: hypothetical protein P0Y53_03995 [Candidatus Pseudobacter hemicellulosilyticus]|uniref:Uncharacterized protein n=1 Tax=Candidatus Pseudobacter hemicellulosilyticus TaxID=3121375 RepID=A0AAJ5WSS9_9BACT|nr:MAG: hypothetical protein P0Y53_03995 [Pseudobacter sp.]
MKKYQRTEWFNQPIRLTEKQRQDPGAILRDFFTWYHLDDLREILWEWMQVGLTTDNEVYQNGRDRSNLLFFCKNIEMLIEAAFLLQDGKNTRKNKNKKGKVMPLPAAGA